MHAQDHFRKVCTPNYVNVFRDRGGVIGVVEFDTPEDLSRAVRLAPCTDCLLVLALKVLLKSRVSPACVRQEYGRRMLQVGC